MRSGATSGSATPAALDQPASTSAAWTVGGGSPAHGGGRGSRTPSSDAAAPAATPGRTGPDNEIHKRPEQAASLDHDTSAEPSARDAHERRARVWQRDVRQPVSH